MVLPKPELVTCQPSVQEPYSNSLLFFVCFLLDCLLVVSELTYRQHGGDDDVGGQGKDTQKTM